MYPKQWWVTHINMEMSDQHSLISCEILIYLANEIWNHWNDYIVIMSKKQIKKPVSVQDWPVREPYNCDCCGPQRYSIRSLGTRASYHTYHSQQLDILALWWRACGMTTINEKLFSANYWLFLSKFIFYTFSAWHTIIEFINPFNIYLLEWASSSISKVHISCFYKHNCHQLDLSNFSTTLFTF